MEKTASKVVMIAPKEQGDLKRTGKRQLRVAAYCRVSTDEEEQLTSYEAQKTYYTDYIMKNPEWTMAGIFADEGISGTSAKKRPEFLRMIRLCKQKKIDMVLAKSISRFARNTVDCLNYIRVLKALGIAVVFEKENINTLESDSEMLITMMGAFAQAESESLSANVRWGKRQAMREGKVSINYKHLYAFRKGADGKPEIIPEEAEVVQEIYRQYLMGASLRMIQKRLEQQKIPNCLGQAKWTLGNIRSILTNEKYCGDVLLQKTYVSDCINKKVVKNTGQLPMYLVKNHHQGIVSREQFDAVQVEMARRNATKTPSKKTAPTGRGCYTSKYALSERLVCGECGTRYRRCTWNIRGQRRVVWGCVSRLDYGKKYCHNSPTLDEEGLQRSILQAINSAMSKRPELLYLTTQAMECELLTVRNGTMTLAEVEKRLEELQTRFGILLERAASGNSEDYTEQFQEIMEETTSLKETRVALQTERLHQKESVEHLREVTEAMETLSAELEEWEESTIRQLIDTVKVVSADEIIVYLYDGMEIHQQMLP
ncbi:MAG: recombinase family protein [Oscillospiraceae bacterium]|nr:recombinase family protein [Oscillospiraceae bacterium]